MISRLLGPCLALLALAGCAAGGTLSDLPGAEPQILAFYEARAFERNATCPQPFISTVTGSEQVSDDGRLVVLRVDYAWDIRLRSSRFGSNCRGFGSRLFTLERAAGGLRAIEMSGEQRGRPAG